MARLVIQNGRVIDPSQSLDDYVNLVVEDGKVAALGAAAGPTDEVWDASGKLVVPGLIDLHAELREPGFEEDETIATGTAAALRGGFATIACLPNTDPPIDSQASVEFVHHQANRAGNCNVVVLACVSKNREGHQLAEIGSLVKAGAVGFTDASAPIHNAELMRRALDYCQMFDRPVMNHPEVLELTRGGIMHDGSTAMILGLAGLPPAAEDVMASRDLRLAEATGGRLHLMNISSEGNVDLLRRVKSRGVTVTADINVANFTLTDEVLRSFDTNCKLNPPLRSRRHVQACIEAIADGTIDAIASGHTPRAVEKKMRDLSEAPFGMVALETA
ncbi:MAG: dihydroorotase, partial [Planctomycetales bacterium]|nr:dihydroorotase [Planctomycetales bacterium]